MDWHIINHRDYIDGPFDSLDSALLEAKTLHQDGRPTPRLRRKAPDFYVYLPPYDRQERWQPEYWICTREAALKSGVPEEVFEQRLLETW
jgi:hypothetical protein